MQRTARSIVRLVGACLVAGCTVVPDPTSGGLESPSDSSRTAVVGNWKASTTSSTQKRTRRLSLSKGFWYQRWTTDSVFATGTAQTTLLEQGAWRWFSGDSSRLVLVPTYRQVGTLVAENLADTVRFGWMADSIQWISHRDSLDTIYWHPG